MFAVSHKPTTPGRFIFKTVTKNIKEKKGANPKLIVAKAKNKEEKESFVNYANAYSLNSQTTPFIVGGSENSNSHVESSEQSPIVIPSHSWRKRFKIGQSFRKDSQPALNRQGSGKKVMKRPKELKMKQKRMNREGTFNCGRWQPEEHQRFIEAIFKFGNEWKQVQRHVGTRSSTQARSHAQKFFVKIKKSQLFDFSIDLSKNSIKTLHDLANSMSKDDYMKAINVLNTAAFERKNLAKKKHNKEENRLLNLSADSERGMNDTLNIKGEDILSLNTKTNEQPFLFPSEHNTRAFPKTKPILGPIHSFTQTQTTTFKEGKTIIINNNINTYNYNLNFSNCEKKDLRRKRNRGGSCEGIFKEFFPNMDRDGGNYFNRNFDDMEYIDHFNCTFNEDMFTFKNEFDVDKELEEVIMINSNTRNEGLQPRKISKDDCCLFDFIGMNNAGYSKKNDGEFHKNNTADFLF